VFEDLKSMVKEKKENQKMSTLDKIATGALIGFGIDAILFPFFSGGQTLHEIYGIPPAGDYKIYSEMTVRILEQGLWGVAMVYEGVKGLYNQHKKK